MRGALLRIVAVAVVAAAASCTSSDESVSGAAPSPVSNLEVQKVTDAEVHLRWSLPPTSVESITILRNGTAIASLPGSTKEFTDQRVDPGTRYRYEVKTTSGAVSSSPVEISTKTIVPPVNEARLDGTYKMTFTTLSSNVDNPGPSVTKGRWRLIPLCNQGPCDARFKTLSGGYSTRLAWIPSDGRYQGSAQRKAYYVCGSQDIDAIAQITVTPDSARINDGNWTATRFRGKLIYDQNESSSCFARAHEEIALEGRRK
jgi:hypothetical protein